MQKKFYRTSEINSITSRKKLQEKISLEIFISTIKYFRLLEGKLENKLYNVHQIPRFLGSISESSYGSKKFFPRFFFILIRCTGYIERRFDQPAFFLGKIQSLFAHRTKKITERFFNKKNSYTKRFLWTSKKQFRKKCFKNFAKKPKTGVTNYEKIYEENFVSKTINFLQNVLLDTFWKSGWKKIAVSPRTLAHDLKFFHEFFFRKRSQRSSGQTKCNFNALDEKINKENTKRNWKNVFFFNLYSLKTYFWTHKMQFKQTWRVFPPTVQKVFVHSSEVLENEIWFKNKLFF